MWYVKSGIAVISRDDPTNGEGVSLRGVAEQAYIKA